MLDMEGWSRMKLTDFMILFVIITLPFVIMLNIKSYNNQYAIDKKIEINRIFDTAVTDAANMLVSNVKGNEIVLNKERALKTFYNTLFLNYGIVDSPLSKARMSGYIPVIIITESDGFTIISKQEYYDHNGELVVKDVIQPKMYYALTRGDYIYMFTIDETITVISRVNGEIHSGKRKDLEGIIDTDVILDQTLFDVLRRQTINQLVEKEINASISHHNEIRKTYGINYEFYSPSVKNGDWSETVDGISMIAIFQGVPLGASGHLYDYISVGGARLSKNRKYYMQQDLINGLNYYHRESCNELINRSNPVDSVKEAAKSGAFPCEGCKP